MGWAYTSLWPELSLSKHTGFWNTITGIGCDIAERHLGTESKLPRLLTFSGQLHLKRVSAFQIGLRINYADLRP